MVHKREMFITAQDNIETNGEVQVSRNKANFGQQRVNMMTSQSHYTKLHDNSFIQTLEIISGLQDQSHLSALFCRGL